LEDVKAQLAGGVDVGMEHLADKLDGWRLIRILLLELHDQPECSVFERRVCWTDNDGVPDVQPD